MSGLITIQLEFISAVHPVPDSIVIFISIEKNRIFMLMIGRQMMIPNGALKYIKVTVPLSKSMANRKFMLAKKPPILVGGF